MTVELFITLNPEFKEYVLKEYGVYWHVLSTDILQSAIEDFRNTLRRG